MYFLTNYYKNSFSKLIFLAENLFFNLRPQVCRLSHVHSETTHKLGSMRCYAANILKLLSCCSLWEFHLNISRNIEIFQQYFTFFCFPTFLTIVFWRFVPKARGKHHILLEFSVSWNSIENFRASEIKMTFVRTETYEALANERT